MVQDPNLFHCLRRYSDFSYVSWLILILVVFPLPRSSKLGSRPYKRLCGIRWRASWSCDKFEGEYWGNIALETGFRECGMYLLSMFSTRHTIVSTMTSVHSRIMTSPKYCLSDRHLQQKLVENTWYLTVFLLFSDVERKVGYNLGGINGSGQVSGNYSGIDSWMLIEFIKRSLL